MSDRPLSTLETELGAELLDVLGKERYETLTVGETMLTLGRFVATFIASSANSTAPERARTGGDAHEREFRIELTNMFGAFALMLSAQMFAAVAAGPLEADDAEVVEWLRRQMGEEGRDAA